MPFKFYAKIRKLKLEGDGKITKKMEVQIQRFVRNCATEWLRAVIIRIPIWTGMSRGAFKYAQGRAGASAGMFLGQYLKIQIPIGPTRTSDGERLARRKGKTPQAGGRQSRYTFSYDRAKHVFRFTFQSNVIHLIWNDFYASAGGAEFGSQGAGMWARPWLALKAGRIAFNNYAFSRAKLELKNLVNFTLESVREPEGESSSD